MRFENAFTLELLGDAVLANGWFITGATGFIGREYVSRLLERTDDTIFVLLRPGSKAGPSARERLLASLNQAQCAVRFDASRLRVLQGDITREGFGLGEDDIAVLRAHAIRMMHLAASTSFSRELSTARRINVSGAQHVIDFARHLRDHGRLVRLFHVSTAYVVGGRTGLVECDDLDPHGSFRNTYERSKAEAESRMRAAANELPITIFRPSIVVGDSRTGRSSGGNTVYWGLRRYLEGHRLFFARADASLDIVPVDYVVDAMMHIATNVRSPAPCYPLVAGRDGAITLGEFARAAADHYQLSRPLLMSPVAFDRLLPMARRLFRARQHRRFLRDMASYLPYFAANPHFSNAPTDAALDGVLKCPPIQSYLPRIFAHCERQGWATANGARPRLLGGFCDWWRERGVSTR
ncbi:MAG: SDR family oxidoreductase [Pseudomonadota bacterium]